MNGLFSSVQQPMAPDMSTMYPQGRPQIQTPQMPGDGQMPQPNGGLGTQMASASAPPSIPPEGMTPQQAEVDAMDALAAQQQKPKYSVGDPTLDKYINLFLGA